MKVLLAHNRYERMGGEDVAFAAERDMLRRAGHYVIEYVRSNKEISPNGLLSTARLAAGTVWAHGSYHALLKLLHCERPDIVHFHNTFPLISPAAYYACHEAGVPVVQTLHNYRLICPAATFLREGKVCEACLGLSVPWPSVVYRCYRNSRAATAAVGAMLTFHHWRSTWSHQVNRYIALTEFSRDKFSQGGLPLKRIAVKPNFVEPDPGQRTARGDYAVFVGRFSIEKGVGTLLDAWSRLGGSVPLTMVGDGPERALAQKAADGIHAVRFLGGLPHERVLSVMKGARFLVFPSLWYEGFPLTIAEAFACGVPVVASRLGAMAEIVVDGRTGLHFSPGEPDDLAAKVSWAWSHEREMNAMGRAARTEYEKRYTAQRNYEILMGIYRHAIQDHAAEHTR